MVTRQQINCLIYWLIVWWLSPFFTSLCTKKIISPKNHEKYVLLGFDRFFNPQNLFKSRNAVSFCSDIGAERHTTRFFYKNLLNFLKPSRSYFFTNFRLKTFLNCSYFYCSKRSTMFLLNTYILAENNTLPILSLKIKIVWSKLLTRLMCFFFSSFE